MYCSHTDAYCIIADPLSRHILANEGEERLQHGVCYAHAHTRTHALAHTHTHSLTHTHTNTHKHTNTQTQANTLTNSGANNAFAFG